jgi:hypothetical protein
MDELITFVKARLDEDEAAAKRASRDKAAGDAWHAGGAGDGWTQAGTPVLRPDEGPAAMAIGDYAAAHIARHDPARVLREVEAKRAIAALHAFSVHREEQRAFAQEIAQGKPPVFWVDMHDCALCGWFDAEAGGCLTVRHLAAVWDGHPDYRQEWAL